MSALVAFMPLKFIKPMEPELVNTPEGGDWSLEIKFDGHRTQVIKGEDGIRLFTKNGFDWTVRISTSPRRPPRSTPREFIILLNECRLR